MHALSLAAVGGVEEFTASMPEGYLRTYDEAARSEHAASVARRGSRTAHVERWRSLPDGGALVLVAADDRPGLLSLICAALVRHQLEVRVAQIYTRQRREDVPEAVDLFWLRALEGPNRQRPVEAHDLEKFADTLAELIEAPPRPLGGVTSRATFEPIAARAFFNTQAMRRGESLLVVEARDYPGLLLTITRTLHALDVIIASSSVETEANVARDSFVLTSASGGKFTPEQLAAIRQAVIVAVRAGPAG
jgi:[protein-PII] uridylyltransferase